MDLSINNINLKNKNINFKGMEGAYDKNTVPVYKFYAPSYDREKYDIHLEYAPLDKDEKTSMFKPPIKRYVKTKTFDSTGIIEVPQAELNRYEGFGYRYKLINKKNPNDIQYLVDPFKSIKINDKEERMNVIERGNFYGVSPKGGSMRHSFLDSDVRLKNGSRAELDKDFVRNHFNKLGGSIEGLNWMLKNTDELAPYRYFMTTPDIGVDKVSSHRYWPANQYQCSDLETFKDFNFELFKQGKGYVADGAFTSQGIQSPLVQHVLKWGEESPFYNWLKIDGRISLGILPDFIDIDGENPYEHIGIRLVNGKGEGYDKSKPTYIQFYDERLLSDEKQVSGKLEFNYDKTPEDHYEITSHQDSVQPYAFEIDPDDKKLKAFKGGKTVLLKDIDNVQNFLIFPNFTIEEKNKVSGTTCWDGNVDIIKMNLSNPNESLANRKGFFDAREYIHGVADYWTNLVQSHLILETAKIKGVGDITKLAENNNISKKRLGEILRSIIDEKTFVSRVTTNTPETKDIVTSFPLQSLETSEELSAIFTQPQFKNILFDEKTTQKISEIFDTTIQNAIPEELKNSAEYKAYVVKTYGNEILRHIFIGALNPNAIKNGEINLNELKKVTLKSLERYASISPEEEVQQVASKIKKGINEQNLNTLQNKIKNELKEITLDKFKIAEAIVLQGKGGLNWRFDAAKDIGDLDAVRDKNKTFDQIWNGEDRAPGVQQFWAEYVRRIRQSNPSAYIINEVTTLDEFTKMYGNDAYNSPEVLHNFDPQLAEYYLNLPKRPKAEGDKADGGKLCEVGTLDCKRHENHPLYAKQTQFLDMTNSTTTSEFAKGFNMFSKFAGVDPEDSQSPGSRRGNAGDLGTIKQRMEELTYFNQPNSAIYSHMFVSNHDKPSVLHTLPLNMSIYMPNNLKESCEGADDETKAIIKFLVNIDVKESETKPQNYKNINPKALAVGIAMYNTIEKLNYSDKEKDALKNSLSDLVNGRKTPASKPSYKRAESFGVKPYEITIKDVIKNANILPEEKLDNAVLEFHSTMLKDSMIYFERMWQVMNACVGVPTLYGGSEFAQTGYETPNKNVYLGIRNEVLHNLQNDKRYEAYFNKMYKTSGLYKEAGLSALRDGVPTSLEMISPAKEVEKKVKKIAESYGIKEQAEAEEINFGAFDYFAKQIASNYSEIDNVDTKTLAARLKRMPDESLKKLDISNENSNYDKLRANTEAVAEAAKEKATLNSAAQIWPIYKKDSKGSQTISIVTNLGLPNGKASFEESPKEKIQYPIAGNKISLSDKDGKCPLADGTILKCFGNELEYIINNGAIELKNGGKLTLTDTVTTFFVPKKLYY